ncbi:MarR family transcriptional regulator [Viridibacterium curvum]|uniref:MarR family transcriptional regulator n=1 Tax=Viridibacterium curvum TaxID=1101404 RepID=A0ABP9QQK9_9RHOO
MQFQPENFRFEESLGYLVGKLRGLMQLALEEEVADLGISAAQAIVLMRIQLYPGLPAAKLCRFSGYDTGAMTRMLDKLEDKGLVARQRSAADRRVVELELTVAGSELCARLPERFCRIGNVLMEDMDPEEVATLKGLLRRTLDKAEQAFARQVAQSEGETE